MPGRDRSQDQSISTARIAELLTITFGYARRSPEFEYHREALSKAVLFGTRQASEQSVAPLLRCYLQRAAGVCIGLLQKFREGVHTPVSP